MEANINEKVEIFPFLDSSFVKVLFMRRGVGRVRFLVLWT